MHLEYLLIQILDPVVTILFNVDHNEMGSRSLR